MSLQNDMNSDIGMKNCKNHFEIYFFKYKINEILLYGIPYEIITYHFKGYLKINKSKWLKIKKDIVKADIFLLNSIFVLPFTSGLWQYILPFLTKVVPSFSSFGHFEKNDLNESFQTNAKCEKGKEQG